MRLHARLFARPSLPGVVWVFVYIKGPNCAGWGAADGCGARRFGDRACVSSATHEVVGGRMADFLSSRFSAERAGLR